MLTIWQLLWWQVIQDPQECNGLLLIKLENGATRRMVHQLSPL